MQDFGDTGASSTLGFAPALIGRHVTNTVETTQTGWPPQYSGAHSRDNCAIIIPESTNRNRAGVVHDFGKVHIPAEILSKPARLSRIEFELVKTHPEPVTAS